MGYFSRRLQVAEAAGKRVYEGSGTGFGAGSAVRYRINERLAAFAELNLWQDDGETEREDRSHSTGANLQYAVGMSLIY